jgi:HD-GYP domain-containing protein (c-di-GMP phosphodiesterase class II)
VADSLKAYLAAQQSRDKSAIACATEELAKEARRRHEGEKREGDVDWFQQVAVLLVASDEDEATVARIECLLTCTLWFLKEGQPAQGVPAAEKARALAEGIHDQSLIRRSWTALGNLHNGSKTFAQASVCFSQATEIARAMGDRVVECASIANLAAARQHSGLLEEATQLNALVIRMAEEMEGQDPRLSMVKQQAQHNTALAWYMLGELEPARKNIEDALAWEIQPRNQFEAYQRGLMECTYVKILCRQGQTALARTRAALAKQYADQAGGAPIRLQARISGFICDANEAKYEDAIAGLKSVILEPQLPEAARLDAIEALVNTYQLAGDRESAERERLEYLTAMSHVQRRAVRTQLDAIRERWKPSWQPVEVRNALPEEVLEQLRAKETAARRFVRAHLEAMVLLADLRNESTRGHAFRVGRLAGLCGTELGMTPEEVEALELTARLHDIGKLVVPDIILRKTGALTTVEQEIYQRHPTDGALFLMEMVQHEGYRHAVEVALSHHEWWDGTGYPRRLKGSEIPRYAQITAIANLFDNLFRGDRDSRPLPFDECISQIRARSGRQFDPVLCTHFVGLLERLHKLHGSGLNAFLDANAEESEIYRANRLIDQLLRDHARSIAADVKAAAAG